MQPQYPFVRTCDRVPPILPFPQPQEKGTRERSRHSQMNPLMRLAPRFLLAFSSLCLAAGGVIHALAFPKASTVADHSTLPPLFLAAFKALWLFDSINSVAFALVFGSIAAFPGMASGSLVMLLACAPLAVAVAVFATMGNFVPGYVMLVAGTAALIGGGLRRKHPGVE
jgi:hypothetical protein